MKRRKKGKCKKKKKEKKKCTLCDLLDSQGELIRSGGEHSA